MAKTFITLRRTVIFSAIISLVAFLYKIGMAVMSLSIILLVASISTLILFICKVIFLRNMSKERERKKRAYLIMTILAASFGVLFLLFAVLKVGNIDTSRKLLFTGALGYIFIGFLLLMFILSIINLRNALDKGDIMIMGLKEMTFVSALADLVIIEEFIYKLIIEGMNIPYLYILNDYFPLLTAVIMLTVPLFMFNRFRKYAI